MMDESLMLELYDFWIEKSAYNIEYLTIQIRHNSMFIVQTKLAKPRPPW